LWAEWLFSGCALCHLQSFCESIRVSACEINSKLSMLPFCSPEM
jgi:hypothetical protein